VTINRLTIGLMNFSGMLSLSVSSGATYRIQAIMVSFCSSWRMLLRMRHQWAWASPWKCTYLGSGGTAEHMQMTLVLICTRLIH